MKKRRILLVLICIFVAFVALIAFNQKYRENVSIMAMIAYSDITKPNDEVTRTIRNGSREWGAAISLTPKPFERGEAEGDVLGELSKAKYMADSDKVFSYQKPRQFPAGSQFYGKTVGGLPCTVHFEVVVRFDADHRLIDAWGARDEAGCL